MDDVLEQLLETWRTNQRITLMLIDRIDEAGMGCTLSTRGGRTVARQLAHLHNVRVWHLQNRARDLAEGLEVFPTHDEPHRERLTAALTASAARIETFIADCVAGRPRRRCLKKGIVATLGYFIAHESHHRGNILLTLKQSGHPLDVSTRNGIWNWDKI